MAEVKQVIVIRKDLNMRKGKMVAQGSHASLGAVLQLMPIKEHTRIFDKFRNKFNYFVRKYFTRTLTFDKDSALDLWFNKKFAKICLYVNSEKELMDIYDKAKEKNLNVCLITDAGDTEFNGVPTKTCLAIGPDFSYRIDDITGNLPLL